MNRILKWIGLVQALWILMPANAAGAGFEFSLSGAIRTTLNENKVLQIHSIGVDIAQDRIQFEKGIYDPFVTGSFEYNKDERPSFIDDLDSGSSLFANAGVGQKNQIGGVSSVNMSVERETIKFRAIPLTFEESQSRIYFKYSQPILRGFGSTITNLKINKAKIGREFSEQQLEEQKSRAFYAVYKTYLDLYQAIEEARIYEEVRRSSEEIYRVVQEKFKMQKLTITDLQKIEATLIVQDTELEKRKNTIAQRSKDFLYAIYNESPRSSAADVALLTTPDQIAAPNRAFEAADTLELRKQYDFNLISLRTDQQLLKKDLLEASDGMKPDLQLSTEVGVSGVTSNSMQNSISGIDSDNYTVQLKGTLLLPLKNQSAKSRYSEVSHRLKQVEIQIANREFEVEKTTEAFFDDLETVTKRLDLNTRLVGLTEQNLRNETERLIAEKATLLDTLQFQTDFSTARLALIQSKIDYLVLVGTYRYYRREMESFLDDSLYGPGSTSVKASTRLKRTRSK